MKKKPSMKQRIDSNNIMWETLMKKRNRNAKKENNNEKEKYGK